MRPTATGALLSVRRSHTRVVCGAPEGAPEMSSVAESVTLTVAPAYAALVFVAATWRPSKLASPAKRTPGEEVR